MPVEVEIRDASRPDERDRLNYAVLELEQGHAPPLQTPGESRQACARILRGTDASLNNVRRASSIEAVAFCEILSLIKRQPQNDVSVDEDHLSSPHTFAQRAGETTSPVRTPLPARKS